MQLITSAAAILVAAAMALAGCGAERHARPDSAVIQRPLAQHRPIATVSGSEPHTHLTLLELRRTGPRFVTTTLAITLDRAAGSSWLPELEGDGSWYTAEGLRLVDEVNGRQHRPFKDEDDNCLCSTDIQRLEPGETTTVSAKFLAPPGGLRIASVYVPGFPSIDAVPVAVIPVPSADAA